MSPSQFLASLDAVVDKATRQSQRENRARTNNGSPDYWRKQVNNVTDPMARSYDALAPFIAPIN